MCCFMSWLYVINSGEEVVRTFRLLNWESREAKPCTADAQTVSLKTTKEQAIELGGTIRFAEDAGPYVRKQSRRLLVSRPTPDCTLFIYLFN